MLSMNIWCWYCQLIHFTAPPRCCILTERRMQQVTASMLAARMYTQLTWALAFFSRRSFTDSHPVSAEVGAANTRCDHRYSYSGASAAYSCRSLQSRRQSYVLPRAVDLPTFRLAVCVAYIGQCVRTAAYRQCAGLLIIFRTTDGMFSRKI